ncbi:MAG: type IV-A pilus assembly ATPase PilB [Nitrospirae bacterium GWF2_44_13]|nr:MAG: type IV-A pilus assembly ATPase PilB [Nitrospirae bacterium GWF2_44_13]OGW63720.1 MAG: type IV-A pilus assembly ATPase PilB [Nitrospirae bacterium RIFOXYA2_FULL_44_9]OGW73695.1 MAG: type IV-A pilus assembly ATPase PilB [Nitrospirae bacterium RIFOXYC2_FULL_44_7]HBG92888.1 type IV-A pilus assembly ATPase PilB [Nitrospiraceae bacterium]
MAAKLGQILIASGVITEEQLNEALKLQKRGGGRLGTNLVKLGHITEDKLVTFLSKQYGMSAIDLAEYKIDTAVLKLITADMAKKHMMMPLTRIGATLTIAMADPSNVFAVDDIKFMTGYNVEVVIATESALINAITIYYGGKVAGVVAAAPERLGAAQKAMKLEAKDYTLSDTDIAGEEEAGSFGEGPTVDVDEFDRIVGDALDDVEHVTEDDMLGARGEIEEPIVKLVSGILINAIKIGASDIHIEPYENSVRVRYRVDGVLALAMNLPLRIKNSVVSRLKIMAKLDISERRLPQDGRIKLRLGKKKEVDFRVSILPCLFGEKVVMRILDKASLQVDLTKLGFEEEALQKFLECLNRPYGMILVTGPTGSGKTTTLYSALNYLNKPNINIMTAEDPIEYNFLGINQVQMKEEIGLTFASALRSFLRQSPDIILVGEIRDFETAEIAVKAALTGHLVLSTLHTNDAPSSVSRLMNMGIEPFLVSSSVILIMAQRLARKLCKECEKEEEKFPLPTLISLGFSEEDAKTVKCYRGKGCSVCNNSGYKGRIALYEIMIVNEEIRKLILEGASAIELKKAAIRGGMKTLRMSGLTKVKEGVTTIEEVLRVTFGD